MKQTGSRRYTNSDDLNRFYVYGHFTKDTDELFYIGKGTAGRYLSTADRSKSWQAIVVSRGFVARILHCDLIEVDAIEKETQLIKEQLVCNPLLVNSVKKFNKVTIDLEVANDIFEYDESSPSSLVWKSTKKPAGWKTKKGWQVESKGISIPVHRVVYLITQGNINWDNPIDHIDGNPFNNSKDNLQNVSVKINNKNRLLKNDTGVPFLHRRERNGEFDSYLIKFDLMGKRISIYFNLFEYQTEEETRVAALAYLISIKQVLSTCGYSERVLNEI
jgi:hypothetical protein